MESVSIQLELASTTLLEGSLQLETLLRLEVIIADDSAARTIRSLLLERDDRSDVVNPALIVVRLRTDDLVTDPLPNQEFDGVLLLPQEPVALATQLSVILYAHRAFARRFQSAMDELNLNRRIFRSVSSGITVAKASLPDLSLIYVNPAFEVMTGYSFEEVIGKNCRFLQGNDHDQAGVTLIREALRAQREVTATIKNYRKDGSFFWNELSLSPIRNREGIVTHIVGIQNDITARVEFEAALRESEKLAAVGRLAASIAHEINNPLEAVTNLLYLARHEESLDNIHTYLGMADSELQRASLITSQSLRFYKQSTKPQAVRPADMLGSVLDLYHGKIENAHITVERRPRAIRPVICLESEIRQVLSNLVRNAIDAMAHGGGRLSVRCREATDWRTGAKGALMTIADTGTGISADSMKKLCTAFFTTKGVAGTGLGLWVSAEIVKRHQGRLKVRSSQQPGATWTVFEIFLPHQSLAA